MRVAKRVVERLLGKAGIFINGSASWDIQVHDDRFYTRVFRQGSLGLGESYMDDWWDCQRLDQFFERVFRNNVSWIGAINPVSAFVFLRSKFTNLVPKRDAFLIGKEHYDLGNDLFQTMLDPGTMAYSCGYWNGLPASVDQLSKAQVAKLDLICRKLGLARGQRVLDIGCGWGSLARHASACYGVRVVGITVSREQARLAHERCRGLPVEIRLQDYRDVRERFDHVVSVGMFEHVGSKNYKTYMETVKKCLQSEGLFLLHTIGSKSEYFNHPDPWMRKYIFPVSEVPARREILKSSGKLKVRDWHEFGRYYDPTLMAWYSRFVAAWGELEAEYGQCAGGKFYRMWKYYLLACAGAFRTGNLELWQVILAHAGQNLNYRAVR